MSQPAWSTLQHRAIAIAPRVTTELCLDFANTVGGWRVAGADEWGIVEERLGEYEDLLAWAHRVGIVDREIVGMLLRRARLAAADAARVVARAHRLRYAIYRTAHQLIAGREPLVADLEVLDKEARLGRAHQRLTIRDGRPQWVYKAPAQTLDSILWRVANAAVVYFSAADLSRLRLCPGNQCGWLFHDTSRNRTRRWCDMAVCGNLHKVQNFRRRLCTKRRSPVQRSRHRGHQVN